MLKKRERGPVVSSGRVYRVGVSLLMMLLIAITYLANVLPVHAGDDDEFDVEVTGRVTDGGNTANVIVTLTNNGKDFGGYVRVTVTEKRSRNEYENAYDHYIAVAEDETETVTISFPVMEGLALDECNIDLYILDEKKQMIDIKKLYHLFDEDASMHVGILCDNPSELDYLTNQTYSPFSYNTTDTQKWESEALMPSEITDGITLASTSLIVIDDFDISTLKKEEINAIQSWVKSGGILVIGTGEYLDATFDAFDSDFIEATLASRQSYDDYSYYATNGYIPFADINFGSSYTAIMSRDVQIKKEGRGGIILAQFSLTEPALDRTYFSNDLRSTTLTYFNSFNAKKYVLSYYELETLFGLMQGQAALNAKLLGAIAVIYVILVGPVLYLVLKKFDKREKIWYAVPIMSVVFVFIVFLASRGFSVRNRMFETIRVARADGSGMEADYIFGFSSSQKAWTMSLKDDVEAAGRIVKTDSYGANANEEYTCTATRSPKGVTIQYRPKSVFESAYFKALQPNPDEYGDITFDLEVKRSGITGTIDNDTDYDFEYVLVACNGYYQLIPDVESGDTCDLSGYGSSYRNIENNLAAEARRLYDKEDYRSAKLQAALAMAAHELQTENTFVIGITSSKDKILQGVGNSEESFLCIYQVE